MSRAPRPRYNRTAYYERARRITALARLAFATQRPIGDLADRLDVEYLDNGSTAHARDLARWAGARKVGSTRRDALEALASAWFSYHRRAQAAIRGDRRARAALERTLLRRRAHERAVTVTAQREVERRVRGGGPRLLALAEFADDGGRTFALLRAA